MATAGTPQANVRSRDLSDILSVNGESHACGSESTKDRSARGSDVQRLKAW